MKYMLFTQVIVLLMQLARESSTKIMNHWKHVKLQGFHNKMELRQYMNCKFSSDENEGIRRMNENEI